MKQPFLDVIILSAGKSSRMDGIDKQLVEIGGKNVIKYSVSPISMLQLTKTSIIKGLPRILTCFSLQPPSSSTPLVS